MFVNRDCIIDLVLQVIAKEMDYKLVSISNFNQAINMLSNNIKTNQNIDFLIVNGNMPNLSNFVSQIDNTNINLPIHIISNNGKYSSLNSGNIKIVRKESLLSDCIKYLVEKRSAVS